MTAGEVAAYLGVHVSTVRRHYRELGGIKLGRVYCFACDQLFAARSAAPDLVQEVDRSVAPVVDKHGLLA